MYITAHEFTIATSMVFVSLPVKKLTLTAHSNCQRGYVVCNRSVYIRINANDEEAQHLAFVKKFVYTL